VVLQAASTEAAAARVNTRAARATTDRFHFFIHMLLQAHADSGNPSSRRV
jgi:hypothetical protein